LLSADPDGNLLREVINESGNPEYKYYYSSPEAIAVSMERVYERTSSWLTTNDTDSDTVDEKREEL
jgi:hypothetical protein